MEVKKTHGIRAIGVRTLCTVLPAALLLFSDAVRAEDRTLRQLIDAQRQRALQFRGEARQLAAPTLKAQTLPYGQNPVTAELAGTRTVVFVSRAMPEQVLLALLEQGAGRADVVYAFRGWGDGGVDKAFRYADALMKKLSPAARKNPPNIIVHPASFAEYSIRYAPAVLHRDTDNKWYLVQGALSVDAATAAIKARQFRNRLSQQWRVSEPDQADVMKNMAKKMDFPGAQKQAARAVAKEMAGSLDLPTARTASSRLYTPYMTAGFDVRHPKTGAVLYPAGTRYNVLALDPGGQRSLLVINGRDEDQVRYARRIVKERPQTLVLYTRLGRLAKAGITAAPINALLVERLGITAVPSYLQQQGSDFRIVTLAP